MKYTREEFSSVQGNEQCYCLADQAMLEIVRVKESFIHIQSCRL